MQGLAARFSISDGGPRCTDVNPRRLWACLSGARAVPGILSEYVVNAAPSASKKVSGLAQSYPGSLDFLGSADMFENGPSGKGTRPPSHDKEDQLWHR
jgi:hypothetical protein